MKVFVFAGTVKELRTYLKEWNQKKLNHKKAS